jgi:hypothetical protein
VSFQHVCEPCRNALGLPAERSYLNRMRRRAHNKVATAARVVVRRDRLANRCSSDRTSGTRWS